MSSEQVLDDGNATGSPTGNPPTSPSETLTPREAELERRRAALQSVADRRKAENEELARQIAALQAENSTLRGPAPAGAGSTVTPPVGSQPQAASPSANPELAELRVRLAKSERRDAIEDFLSRPENADLAPLRHMIPQTMDVSELPTWAANMRSLGPALARSTANAIVNQVVAPTAAPGSTATGEPGAPMPAAVNTLGGYVPFSLAQQGGPAAISAGGAGSGTGGSSTVTPEEIDAAFKDIKPGDHEKIWDTVGALFKRIPLPRGMRQQ